MEPRDTEQWRLEEEKEKQAVYQITETQMGEMAKLHLVGIVDNPNDFSGILDASLKSSVLSKKNEWEAVVRRIIQFRACVDKHEVTDEIYRDLITPGFDVYRIAFEDLKKKIDTAFLSGINTQSILKNISCISGFLGMGDKGFAFLVESMGQKKGGGERVMKLYYRMPELSAFYSVDQEGLSVSALSSYVDSLMDIHGMYLGRGAQGVVQLEEFSAIDQGMILTLASGVSLEQYAEAQRDILLSDTVVKKLIGVFIACAKVGTVPDVGLDDIFYDPRRRRLTAIEVDAVECLGMRPDESMDNILTEYFNAIPKIVAKYNMQAHKDTKQDYYPMAVEQCRRIIRSKFSPFIPLFEKSIL